MVSRLSYLYNRNPYTWKDGIDIGPGHIYSLCDVLGLPTLVYLLSGVPDYFGRNKISSAGDLSHYSSASLY